MGRGQITRVLLPLLFLGWTTACTQVDKSTLDTGLGESDPELWEPGPRDALTDPLQEVEADGVVASRNCTECLNAAAGTTEMWVAYCKKWDKYSSCYEKQQKDEQTKINYCHRPGGPC